MNDGLDCTRKKTPTQIHEEGRKTMCTIMEDLRKDSEIQNSLKIAWNMLCMNLGTVNEIAEITGLPVEKVKELATKTPANGWSSL